MEATGAVGRVGAAAATGQLRGCSIQRHSSPWPGATPCRAVPCRAKPLQQPAKTGTNARLVPLSLASGVGGRGREIPMVTRAPVKRGVSELCLVPPRCSPHQLGLPALATGQKCHWAPGDGHGLPLLVEPGLVWAAAPAWEALTSSALCACGWLSRKVPSSTEATMVRPLPALSCDVKDRSCGCTTFCS